MCTNVCMGGILAMERGIRGKGAMCVMCVCGEGGIYIMVKGM